jgi:hypothetical protein
MTKKLDPAEKARRKQAQLLRYNRRRSADKVAWAKAKRQKCRLELIARYGGRCNCCGLSDYRWLSLHHKNHDGGAERRQHKRNAANRLYHLVKQPIRDDLELLCYNCHLSQDFFGCCPHNDPASPYFIGRAVKSALA